ncbi:MucR family transcriptional regulator [Sphingomonas sp. 1P08PE]
MNDPKSVFLATELTMAWLGNPHNRVSADDVPAFFRQMHSTVEGLAAGTATTDTAPVPEQAYAPAVTARKSLADPDFIISMIDGKKYKTLKRHLKGHGLTAAEYRERYGLKADYPMVARNYASMRSNMAKKIGLGRKPGEKVKEAAADLVEAAAEPVKAVAKRARKTLGLAKKAAQDHLG